MSKSSPADLVVAFRSFVRREAQAIEAADGSPVQGLAAELAAHLAAAGALLHVGADPNAIANAIAATPADEFDIPTLDALRQHALDAGAVLRKIAAARPSEDD